MRWVDRPHRCRILAGAGVIAALLAGSLRWIWHDDNDRGEEQVHAAGWHNLPEIPLSPRSNPLYEWTGQEVVVLGGNTVDHDDPAAHPLSDGAAYNPDTGSWRMLPDAPFPAPPLGPQGVWTGKELVVVASPCIDRRVVEEEDSEPICDPGGLAGAAFDPESNQWREIAVPAGGPDPQERDYGALGWTGVEAVFEIRQTFQAYDPAEDTWRTLPEPVFEPRLVCVDTGGMLAWTATDFIYATTFLTEPTRGHATVPMGPVDRASLFADLRVATLAPGGTEWSPVISAAQRLAPDAFTVFCGGDGVLVLSPERQPDATVGDRYSGASSSWLPVTPPPIALLDGRHVWSGTEHIFWPEGGPVAYNPATDTWRVLTASPDFENHRCGQRIGSCSWTTSSSPASSRFSRTCHRREEVASSIGDADHATIEGHERCAGRLGQGHVAGVVGREVPPQLPSARGEQVEGPQLEREVEEVGVGLRRNVSADLVGQRQPAQDVGRLEGGEVWREKIGGSQGVRGPEPDLTAVGEHGDESGGVANEPVQRRSASRAARMVCASTVAPVAATLARARTMTSSTEGLAATSMRKSRRYAWSDLPARAARAAHSSRTWSGTSRMVIAKLIAAH